jgi:hypothetical protein
MSHPVATIPMHRHQVQQYFLLQKIRNNKDEYYDILSKHTCKKEEYMVGIGIVTR